VDIDIALHAIQLIETSDEKLCPLNCGIDIHTYVNDAADIKVFTFLAQTSSLAKLWMEQLCAGVGTFELKPKQGSSGAYESVRAVDLGHSSAKAAAADVTPQKQRLASSSDNYSNLDDEDSAASFSSPVTTISPSPRASQGAVFAKRGLLDVRRSQVLHSSPVPVTTDDLQDEIMRPSDRGSTPPPSALVSASNSAIGASALQTIGENNAALPSVPTISLPSRGGRGGRGRGDGSLRRLSSSEETIQAMRRPPPVPNQESTRSTIVREPRHRAGSSSGESEHSSDADDLTKLNIRAATVNAVQGPGVGTTNSQPSSGFLLGEEDDEEPIGSPASPVGSSQRVSVTASAGGRSGGGARLAGRGRGFKS
jgi:hypothetical protein